MGNAPARARRGGPRRKGWDDAALDEYAVGNQRDVFGVGAGKESQQPSPDGARAGRAQRGNAPVQGRATSRSGGDGRTRCRAVGGADRRDDGPAAQAGPGVSEGAMPGHGVGKGSHAQVLATVLYSAAVARAAPTRGPGGGRWGVAAKYRHCRHPHPCTGACGGRGEAGTGRIASRRPLPLARVTGTQPGEGSPPPSTPPPRAAARASAPTAVVTTTASSAAGGEAGEGRGLQLARPFFSRPFCSRPSVPAGDQGCAILFSTFSLSLEPCTVQYID